jgi:16S rRNA C967 or C1407 C5-methylase (RsmB/RsmF family)/NOL1/NOP2/fmu family ribosome biogenesis protein
MDGSMKDRDRQEDTAILPLPQGFLESLAPLLKEEMQDFLQSYLEPFKRGLRTNPEKIPQFGIDAWVPGLEESVPWEKDGRYIPLGSPAGLHPLHEAGAYYLQEPSAMAAVNALDPKPGEWVLDLCAAPGGKSTQIAARMEGKGLVVCNEPVYSRAQVLSRNLERMGVAHSLVTCETPERLSPKWAGLFDRVLADAPCSGEGMFRRHPETRAEWNEKTPGGCKKRQSEILHSAAMLVKDGGVLCYSTCTFNSTENEGVVEGFLKDHPAFSFKPFTLTQNLVAGNGMLHLFPHKMKGEGQFVALLEKKQSGSNTKTTSCKPLTAPDQESLAAYHDFCISTLGGHGPKPSGLFAGRLVCLPALLPDISGLKVLRAGLHLGESKGKRFLPDHAFAMSGIIPESCLRYELTLSQAGSFLKGETLPTPENRSGWIVMELAGLPLGWGKAVEGRVQNHYPKGLRKG